MVATAQTANDPVYFGLVWAEGSAGAICPQCGTSHRYYSPHIEDCPDQPPCRALVYVYPAYKAQFVREVGMSPGEETAGETFGGMEEIDPEKLEPKPWIAHPLTGQGAVYSTDIAAIFALSQMVDEHE